MTTTASDMDLNMMPLETQQPHPLQAARWYSIFMKVETEISAGLFMQMEMRSGTPTTVRTG